MALLPCLFTGRIYWEVSTHPKIVLETGSAGTDSTLANFVFESDWLAILQNVIYHEAFQLIGVSISERPWQKKRPSLFVD